LGIKAERIRDTAKQGHVRAEMVGLETVRARTIADAPKVAELIIALRTVNEVLWQAEDDIRQCEHDRDFGARFIELACSIYRHNDERSRLKRRLNDLLGAPFAERRGAENPVTGNVGVRRYFAVSTVSLKV
jgi:hypothetical protein